MDQNNLPVWSDEYGLPEDEGRANVPRPTPADVEALPETEPAVIDDVPYQALEQSALIRWPKRKTTTADLTADYEAAREKASGPATLDDFRRAVEDSLDLDPASAITRIRQTGKRLPEEMRAQLPAPMVDPGTNATQQWEYLQRFPKTLDMMRDPAVQKVLGPKYQQVGALEKLYYKLPLSPGPWWLGFKRGFGNVVYGREAEQQLLREMAGGSGFDDPEFQARMYEIMDNRAADHAFLEALKLGDGTIVNLAGEFPVNFGDTIGGMARSAVTPEAAGGAVGGAALGAVTGWGALGAAISGGLTGISAAQAGAAGGANAWEQYLAMPEDMRDDELVRRTFFLTAIPSFALERIGAGFMLRGAGPGLQKVAGGALRGLSPAAAERASTVLASKTYRGIMARLAVNTAWHTAPEVITEALQEGPVEVGARMLTASQYNRRYGGQGYQMPVPTWEEMKAAAYAGGRQALLGGAGIGLIGPGLQALNEAGMVAADRVAAAEGAASLPPMSEEQAEALIDYAADAGLARARLVALDRSNAEIKRDVKAAVDNIRDILQSPEVKNNPDILTETIAGFGEKNAYANAEAIQTLFQTVLERSPGLDLETLQSAVLEPLGVSADTFQDALDNGTDVQINLTGLPEAINSTLWDDAFADLVTVEPQAATEELRRLLDETGPPRLVIPTADADISMATRQKIENDLIQAGRKKSWARQESAVWSRMIGRLAARSGINPDALAGRVSFAREADAGPAGPGSLNQAAMYRSRAKSLDDFIDEALASDPTAARPFRHLDNDFGNTVVELGADQVAHIRKGHPTFTEWSRLPEVIENGEQTPAGPNRVTGTNSIAYVLNEGDSSLVVVAAPDIGGTGRKNRVKRTIVLTAFRDSSSAVSNWLANNEAASSQSVEDLQLDPRLSETDPSGPQSGLESIISRPSKKNKPLFQSEGKIKGRLDTLADGRFRIVFTPEADASTAIHEFEHAYVQLVQDILSMPPESVTDPAAHAELAADFRALEDWAGVKDGQWTVEAHEKTAVAFERYFMEGRAPVSALRAVFRRMKELFLSFYALERTLGEPLSDDIIEVFDRQLATEEELMVESLRSEPIISSEELREADEEQWREYENFLAESQSAREQEITEFRNAEHERLLKQWRKEGRPQALENPTHQEIREIALTGINLDSLTAAGYDQEAISALRKLRRGLVRADRPGAGKLMGVDEWAEHFGYDGADAFVQDLLSVPSVDELIQRYVDQMESYFEDYFNSDSIMTDAEMSQFEFENNILGRRVWGEKYKARSWKDIKNFIDRKMGVKPVDEIVAQDMAGLKASLKAQARAAREISAAGRAEGQAKGYKSGVVEGYRVGWREAAAEAAQKRVELAAHLKSLAEQRREVDRAIANWRRIVNQKTADPNRRGGIMPEYHGQIKNMLAMFGFGQQVLTESTFQDFIESLERDGAAVAVPDWIRTGNLPKWTKGVWAGRNKTYRSLSYQEFTELKNAVANLAFLGRRQQQVRVGGKLLNEDQVAQDLTTSIAGKNIMAPARSHQKLLDEAGKTKSLVGRLVDMAGGYIPGIIKVETVARRLDGGEYGGLAQKVIFDPIEQAYNKAVNLTDQLIEGKLKPLIEAKFGLKNMRNLRGEKVTVEVPGLPEQNFTMTREQLMVHGLNLGNAQNFQAARGYKLGPNGGPMTDQQVQAVIDTLTKQEWDLIQAIWDFLDNDVFPLLNDLTLRTKGIPLAKVEATPIMTPYGEYRGGYFPLIFDSEMSTKAESMQEKREISLTSPTLFASNPNTRAGSTVERTGRTYQDLYPRLSFDVMARSLTENIHDLTHREAINDVWRVIRRPDVRQSITSAMGGRQDYWVNIKRWLQEIARPSHIGDGNMSKILRKLRANTSAAAMGMKLSVMLCQVTGITQSILKIGAYWAGQGVVNFYGNIGTLKNEIDAKSTLMRNRAKGSYDRDALDALSTHDPLFKKGYEQMIEFSFKGIAVLDLAAVYPIWYGSYLKALKEGKTEEDAVYYADAIVRTTQPMGASKDLSYAQRGWGYGEWGKIITMFSTFFSGTQNLLWEQFHQTRMDFSRGEYLKGTVQAGRAGLLLALIPAMLDFAIKEGLPDDEDDLKAIAKGAVSFTTGGMPVVKDVVSMFIGNSYRFQPAPIFGSLEAISKLPNAKDSLAEGNYLRAGQQVLRGVGPLTGLPTGQINTTLAGIEDRDDNEGFEAFYRLMVRGNPTLKKD